MLQPDDFCPCESGRKYRYCCLPFPRPGQLFGRGPKEKFAGQKYCGLHPNEVDLLLMDPYEAPNLVQFSEHLTIDPVDAPIIMLLDDLRQAIETGPGLKATKTGALPVWFVKQTAEKWYHMEHHPSIHDIHKPGREDTFHELHCTKTILKVTGMLRIHRGKFILSKDCRTLIQVDEGGYRAVWPVLFRRMATKFNWGYWDGFSIGSEFQTAWPFVLYTLVVYGDRTMAAPLYWNLFRQAFPGSFETVDHAMRCFESRVLERFFELFGLIELEYRLLDNPSSPYPERMAFVTATPLLFDAVRFDFLEGKESGL